MSTDELKTICIICLEPLTGAAATGTWTPKGEEPIEYKVCLACSMPVSRKEQLDLAYLPAINIRRLLKTG